MSGAGFLEAAARRFAPLDERAPAGRWLNDPAGFARDAVVWPAGEGLAPYQAEALDQLPKAGRVAVRGPHGLGKTTTNVLALLWFAVVHDAVGIGWKVVTTAGGWRQLEKYLWPEVHKWARRLRWDAIGREPFSASELMTLSLRLTHGEAFAVASDQAELIEGAHADAVLFIYDEGKSISAGTFDASEGAFSGATGGRRALALAQSTPGVPSGRFYDIHARKPGLSDWWVRHVRLGEAVAAGRVSEGWARQRALQWGVDSALYRNRVLGEFHSSDEDGVVPLGWAEAAQERWQRWDDAGRPELAGRRVVAADVARSGSDSTVIAERQGQVVLGLHRYRLEDTMTTAARVDARMADVPQVLAVIDVIGIGAGVVDRLRQVERQVVAFNASGRSERRDRSGELGFLNLRAEAWWSLREALDPAFGSEVCLPVDDQLLADLVSPRWRIAPGGRLQIESKDDIRRRLGRSPDAGDAVVMALFPPAQSATAGGIVVSRYDGMPDWDADERPWLTVRDGRVDLDQPGGRGTAGLWWS